MNIDWKQFVGLLVFIVFISCVDSNNICISFVATVQLCSFAKSFPFFKKFLVQVELIFLDQLHQLPKCTQAKNVLKASRNSCSTCDRESNFVWPSRFGLAVSMTPMKARSQKRGGQMKSLCPPQVLLEFLNPFFFFFSIPKPSALDPVGIMHTHQPQHKDYRRVK